jgi:hypothetical protein
MKILITYLLLFTAQMFSQTFLNVAYSNSFPTNSTSLAQIGKITFSGSGMNFVLTNNTTVTKDLSTINKLTFGSSDLGNPLPVELTSFLADSKGRAINLKWTTATEVNTLRFEIQRTYVTNQVNSSWVTVGTVNAHVNSSSPNSYTFTDKNQEAGNYNYRLKIVDKNGSYTFTETVNAEVALPDQFELKQNYPNPFNPNTVIAYNLPFDCNVKMAVYDVAGRLVKEVVNENQKAGYHDYNFSARALSSGVYFYSVTAVASNGKSFHSVKKFTLIK